MSGWQMTSENSEDLAPSEEEEADNLNPAFNEDVHMTSAQVADEPVDLTEPGKLERAEQGVP